MPDISCEASPEATQRDGNCLIHGMILDFNFVSITSKYSAICDSILNNDALKHNGKEEKNETWSNLLKELKFYENIEDHNMFLRSRWALGAAEWLSGGNNSKQNDKEILGYTDEEWNYI